MENHQSVLKKKITDYLTEDVSQFIKESPFAVLSTSDSEGNCDETAEMIQGLLITINESYRHCPRALSFSNLWNLKLLMTKKAKN